MGYLYGTIWIIEFEISRRMTEQRRRRIVGNDISSHSRGEGVNLLLGVWLQVVADGLKAVSK